MGRNKTWVREDSSFRSNHFNPLGNRRDRPPYAHPLGSKGGKGGKGDDRDKGKGGGPNRGGTGAMDKVATKLLNLYCEKKWNEQARMIDLSGLTKAEDVAELNVNLNNTHFCDRLALVIAQGGTWAGKLDSLNLSNNGIYSLKNLAQALNYHDVRIQNLALTGNKIKDLSEVDYLLDMRLREVLLKGNPIEQQGDSYHKYVVKKLRTVELLDQVSVKEWRKELLPKLPDPQDSCMTDHAQMVFQMCALYFAAVDQGNFDALLDAYDSKCVFSCVSEPSTRIFKFPGSKNYHANLQFKSHNLKLAYNVKKPWNCVFSGRSKIVEFLRNDLYAKIKVKHDVSTFKADALTMGDTIVATLHGQFSYSFAGDRDNIEYQRCFDRVFILKPNRVGTEWPARISNDSVTIRSMQDTPMMLPPVDLRAQLMAATRLTEEFATLLMKEAGNNYDQALALFNSNKAAGNIPQNAFQPA
jgi:hypothetical protein